MRIPESINKALGVLARGGFEGWLVGGCVRDSLMGKQPHDWDVTTAALPGEMLSLFADYKLIETGLKHGTVTVVIDGEPIEITTFRIDGEYRDNRRPVSVSFTSELSEDLSRRDFTVNAMAFSPQRGICDLFGGREDLDAGVIRCVGDPDLRFAEDGLRILRALRFASVLDFEIAEGTAESVRRNRELLRNISAERIFSEFVKLLCGAGAERILRSFPEVIAVFVPEVMPCVGFPQNTPWHDRDVWEHTVAAVNAAERDPIMRLSMFFHDLGKPACFTEENGRAHFRGHPAESARIAGDVLSRLKSDNATAKTVKTVVAAHEETVRMPAEVIPAKRLVRRYGYENAMRLLASARADLAAKPHIPGAAEKLDRIGKIVDALRAGNACVDLGGLAVGGRELIEAGVPKGKAVGEVLEKLLSMVIEESVENERGALIKAAEALAESKKREEN
ncbi:MAG: tRNA nucleotidyltransferase [Clostridiales bacterium]|nr:tRNA nucleotidyltransferase [Clostridiales bacterium]